MMRPRLQSGLLALRETYGAQLVLRVSLDHYGAPHHDEERGVGGYDLTVEGVDWLAQNGFVISLAGRTLWHEPEEENARRLFG